MLFQNDKIKVRLLEEKDISILSRWLSNPTVLEFYEGRDNPFDESKVKEKFFNQTNGVIGCMVEYEEKAVGYIQFYPLDDQSRKDYGYSDTKDIIYGIDQFIGVVDYWNKGIGKTLVSSMVNYLIEHKNASKVVLDPQTQNERAIRCYEKCQFQKVKLLPKNEYHEGEYRDCWLMEFNKH